MSTGIGLRPGCESTGCATDPPTGYAPPLDSTLLTSASLHDSQAAIPLATLSAERTTNLYDLMDAAYDAEQIREHWVFR